ncbi:hypothetical protein ACFYXM_11275 [Streptomyces sp. NPDC002476]|uniref:hypothetical protein n=1 Tax=Streptomyces sp. NPDC002476 TaxID=3364648 RepID=UPI0036736E6C
MAPPQPADSDPVVVVAERLADVADVTVRQALDAGQTIRRAQGYSVRVTGPVSVHLAMIEHSATALMQSPAGLKAHRVHSNRVAVVNMANPASQSPF